MSTNDDGAVPAQSVTLRAFEPYVRIEIAAKFLGVPITWLYEQSRLGKVPSRKCGKYRVYKLSELEAWMNRK